MTRLLCIEKFLPNAVEGVFVLSAVLITLVRYSSRSGGGSMLWPSGM